MAFHLKQNDTAPAIRGTIKDGNGEVVNLAGASARFLMRTQTGSVVVDAAAVIVNAAAGIVEYVWQVGDTAIAGLFRAEFEITYSDGSVATFPNVGYIDVQITDDIA